VARAAAALCSAAALLAGCSGSSGKPAAAGAAAPFADCAALTSAPAPTTAAAAGAGAASSGVASSGGGSGGAALPELALPCFTGGRPVDIGQIRGPALINLWASWCAPCRQELPVFQRLAGRAGDRVHVIGVVTGDDRGAAQSLADDLGVSFPAVYDREAALQARLGKVGLPVTVFVGAGGRISYVYNSTPLDDGALARLVERHLGVVAPA
jgi:thiol-disulfide isomerase/thioredoxin